jgi:parallel beta-helix repeat protein
MHLKHLKADISLIGVTTTLLLAGCGGGSTTSNASTASTARILATIATAVPANNPGLREPDGSIHVIPTPSPAPTIVNVLTRAAELGKSIDLADNASSDQAAIDAVLADVGPGNTIYFPNGTYNVSTIALKKSGVHIMGQSRDGAIIKSSLSLAGSAMSITGLHDIVVGHLTFTSTWAGTYSTDTVNNNPSAGGPLNMIATGKNTYNVTIDSIVCEKFDRICVRIGGGSHDILVKSSIARNATDVGGGGAGYGFVVMGDSHLDADGNPFLGNPLKDTYFVKFDNNTTVAPYIRHGVIVQYWAHHNLITNSNFDGTRLDSIDLHGEDEYANEITGNPVTNSQRAAIALGNSGAGHDKTGVDNWIHDNDLVGNTLGISVEYGTQGTIIEGNTIRDNASLAPVSPRGIVLGSSSGIRISGNTISNNTVPGFVAVYLKDNAAEGTEPAGGPKNWTISGNTVTNSGTAFKDAASLDSGNTIQATW